MEILVSWFLKNLRGISEDRSDGIRQKKWSYSCLPFLRAWKPTWQFPLSAEPLRSARSGSSDPRCFGTELGNFHPGSAVQDAWSCWCERTLVWHKSKLKLKHNLRLPALIVIFVGLAWIHANFDRWHGDKPSFKTMKAKEGARWTDVAFH